MADLEQKYGRGNLRIHRDAQDRLHVETPDFETCSKLAADHSSSSDYSMVRQAHALGRSITQVDEATGETKSFHPDGTVNNVIAPNAVAKTKQPIDRLEMEEIIMGQKRQKNSKTQKNWLCQN